MAYFIQGLSILNTGKKPIFRTLFYKYLCNLRQVYNYCPPLKAPLDVIKSKVWGYIGVYTRKNGQNARSGPIFGDFWSKYLSRPIFYGRNGFPTQKWVRMHLETPLLPFMVALLFKKDQKRLRHSKDENLHNTPCTKCDCATRNQTKYALFLR